MKTKPFATESSSFPHDARIDAVLRAYAHAVPTAGLESRIAARLAAMPLQTHRFERTSRLLLLRRLSAVALALAAACAIVAGTVRHSHHAVIPTAARTSRSGGLSTAGSAHVPIRAVPETPTIDPQAPRTPPHGRATNSGSQTRRGATGQPQSPYPPHQQNSQPTTPQH